MCVTVIPAAALSSTQARWVAVPAPLDPYCIFAWFAFFLPKATPEAIVRKLNEATVATLTTPAVQTRLLENGTTVVGPERRSPEYLQQFLESEIKKWAAAIKAAGIAPE